MNKIIEEHLDKSGEWHRIGGPAVVWGDGSMFWCRHGKWLRRGGAADDHPSGAKFWHINDHFLRALAALPERAHGIMELFL